MKYQAILFDMDGTLLPMNNDEFTKGYFGFLIKATAHFGYTKDNLVPAMWKGVAAMVKNDGTKPNADRFWAVFADFFGQEVYSQIPTFDAFYKADFNKAIMFTKPTKLARRAVDAAKAAAEKVVVATNPFFPAVAVDARLSWAGLNTEEFNLVTDYENSRYCKPNPKYYAEICEKLGLDPTKCLMVGNNTKEDIWAAQQIGMDTYLVTDCIIEEGETPETKKGTLAELCKYLEK